MRGHCVGIEEVPIHAHMQGLDADQVQERVERRLRRADVAQQHKTAFKI